MSKPNFSFDGWDAPPMTVSSQNQAWHFKPVSLLLLLVVAATACGEAEPRQPDLPKRPDRWVNSVALDSSSEAHYVGQTRDFVITSISSVTPVNAPPTIRTGDEIEGLKIGAIKCSFHWRDASYGGEQYMWRGRWACMAGRDSQQVANAVGDDGEKQFEYIHIAPVTLDRE